MKLEDIIKDKNKLLRSRWFKRKRKNYCIRWNIHKEIFEYMTAECDNKNEEIKPYCFNFDMEAFVADDWEWLEEKWYEGDFKKKYPNGVVCYVWNDNSNRKYKTIITNYLPNDSYPFWTPDEITWQFAEPVKPEKAPAIIGGKNE